MDGVNAVALTDVAMPRSSLREAAQALTEMRILVPPQGDGTDVPAPEPRLAEMPALAAGAGLDCTALHLVQVRRMLEPEATALAAGRIDQENVRRLGKLLVRSEAASSPEEFVRLDIDFHHQIVDIMGNPIISRQLQVLSTMTKRLRILRARVPYALEQSHREHRAILAALAAHDTQIAAAAAAAHISGFEQWLENYLDRHG